MKVEIISIGDQLLMSDILDTNAAHTARSLRQIHTNIICKITVGDDLAMIGNVVRIALERADVVITIGGIGAGRNQFARPAIANVLDRTYVNEFPGIEGAITLGGPNAYMPGMKVIDSAGVIFSLPSNRNELAYLLETEVLPYIRQNMSMTKTADWMLLRVTGIMGSTLKQTLDGIAQPPHQKLTFDSFAGQANIRLWVEALSKDEVAKQLNNMKEEVLLRLGDHVFGEGEDRLEDIVIQLLQNSNCTLAVAECFTQRVVTRTLERSLNGSLDGLIEGIATQSEEELAEYLRMDPVRGEDDMIRWCREAAELIRKQTNADLALIVFKSILQGGIQVLVTLASSNGVSVMNRSFGGYPDYIDDWACTLGLTHLRRWLLVHS